MRLEFLYAVHMGYQPISMIDKKYDDYSCMATGTTTTSPSGYFLPQKFQTSILSYREYDTLEYKTYLYKPIAKMVSSEK